MASVPRAFEGFWVHMAGPGTCPRMRPPGTTTLEDSDPLRTEPTVHPGALHPAEGRSGNVTQRLRLRGAGDTQRLGCSTRPASAVACAGSPVQCTQTADALALGPGPRSQAASGKEHISGETEPPGSGAGAQGLQDSPHEAPREPHQESSTPQSSPLTPVPAGQGCPAPRENPQARVTQRKPHNIKKSQKSRHEENVKNKTRIINILKRREFTHTHSRKVKFLGK